MKTKPKTKTDPNAAPFTADADDAFTADDSGYPDDFEIEGQNGPITEEDLRLAEKDLFPG
jgi:hypothetical protein